MAELADARDLKSRGTRVPYRFKPGFRHQKKREGSSLSLLLLPAKSRRTGWGFAPTICANQNSFKNQTFRADEGSETGFYLSLFECSDTGFSFHLFTFHSSLKTAPDTRREPFLFIPYQSFQISDIRQARARGQPPPCWLPSK